MSKSDVEARSKNATSEIAAKVRTYLASMPKETRSVLQKIRAVIRTNVPRATEAFSYGIPGFKLDGKPFLWYAGFKHHTSLYPMTAAIRRAHAAELKGYKTSTGTIQFPLSEPLPLGVVKRLVKARAAEVRKQGSR